MFNNIGKKIKLLATALCYFGILCSVILGLIIASMLSFWSGIAVLVIGSLVAWCASFTMYGFGTLIEDTRTIRDLLADPNIPQGTPYLTQSPSTPAKKANVAPSPNLYKKEPTLQKPAPSTESPKTSSQNNSKENSLTHLQDLFEAGVINETQYWERINMYERGWIDKQ